MTDLATSKTKQSQKKKSKKILLFSTKFPPPDKGESLAGFEFAQSFSLLGYEVSVLTPNPDAVNTPEFNVFTLPCFLLKNIEPQVIYEKTRTVFNKIEPDLLFINGTLSREFESHHAALKTICLQKGIPTIYRPHSPIAAISFDLTKPPFFGIAQTLRLFLLAIKRMWQYKSVSQVVFLTSQRGVLANQDRLIASIFRMQNISKIPNTFSSIRIKKTNFRNKYKLSGCLFICIASFSTLKSQRNIVTSIKESDITDTTFVFIAPERNNYAVETEKTADKDSRFVFLYNIPRQDVIEAHNECDCLILFSKQEQQPLVILEAMCCQKPWICTDVGSVKELKGGLVLRRRTGKQLIEAIKTMQDPSLRETFGIAGFEQWKSTFSPETVYSQWDKLLTDAVSHNLEHGGC